MKTAKFSRYGAHNAHRENYPARTKATQRGPIKRACRQYSPHTKTRSSLFHTFMRLTQPAENRLVVVAFYKNRYFVSIYSVLQPDGTFRRPAFLDDLYYYGWREETPDEREQRTKKYRN